MAQTDDLCLIIKSLSRAEKRYFRLFCDLQQGDKVYLALYNLIGRGKLTSEEVKAQLRKQHPESLYEPARKHLYRILMRCLRCYEAEKSTEARLLNLIQDIRILFQKGLVALGLAEIDRAKQIALNHEKLSYFHILARMELQYLTSLEFPGMDEASLLQRQDKLNEILCQELFIHRHSSLYEVLLFRYFQSGMTRSEREIEKLNDLLLEEFQINANGKYNSFESDKLHLHFQSTYFMMTGGYEQSLSLFYDLNQLFEQNTRLWQDAPLYYVYLLNGILTDLKSIRKYDDMRYFIERLKQIPPQSASLDLLVQHLVLQYEIGIRVATGKFEEGLVFVKQYEEKLAARRAPVSPNTLATLQYNAAVVYLGLGKYKAALQYVNMVLNAGQKFISRQVYGQCRLLNLILHFELGNYEYLGYELRSVERQMKGNHRFYKVEKATVSFLKKRLLGKNHQGVLEQFYAELMALEADPYEAQFLHLFELTRWAEAKLRKMPLAEVAKRDKLLV